MWVEHFGLRSNLLVGICLGAWLSGYALVLGRGEEERGPWDKKKKSEAVALLWFVDFRYRGRSRKSQPDQSTDALHENKSGSPTCTCCSQSLRAVLMCLYQDRAHRYRAATGSREMSSWAAATGVPQATGKHALSHNSHYTTELASGRVTHCLLCGLCFSNDDDNARLSTR